MTNGYTGAINAGSVQTEIGSSLFNVNGITSIVWGTEMDGITGINGNSGYSGYYGYIVTSASESARIEEINIEQSAGFEAVVILLNKGFDVDITVIDDTSIVPPTIANNPLTFSSPFGSFNCLLVGSKADQARKREGMRTFTIKSFNAITGAH
jgi:hypothetical protein